MPDRPIIFSAPMVRALLEGKKTQTRRVLRPQPDTTSDPSGSGEWGAVNRYDYWRPAAEVRPYQVGDRLYVREAHSLHRAHGKGFKTPADDHGERWGPWSGLPIAVSPDKTQVAYYREGFDRSGSPKWRPSIHMPRWASRLTLTVTDVRVQRLQDISEADAVAEGIERLPGSGGPNHFSVLVDGGWLSDPTATGAYGLLWDHIHDPGAWDANPWVVALTFTVQRGNIDQMPGVAR